MPSVNVAYPEEIFHKLGEQEVVLLVAPPASGKTTLSTRFQELGYVRVNQDESGSLKTCIQQGKDALAQGKSVVVDNTNLNVATRATWLEIARLHNVKVSRLCLSKKTRVISSVLYFHCDDSVAVS